MDVTVPWCFRAYRVTHSRIHSHTGRYQSVGRKHVQSRGAVEIILPLLWSEDHQVRARAAGVVHNLSSDAICVEEIREHDGIQALFALLKDTDSKVTSAAAGAVQNLAREPASRRQILALPGSVRLLASLLFRSDAQCQAFAVGALLNLLSPNLEVRWVAAGCGWLACATPWMA
jgi:hypothetical protein